MLGQATAAPVAAGRVTLRLLCRGCSLQRLLLQWSSGSRAHGLPWLQRRAQRCDAQTHGPVQQASSRKAQVRRPSCRDDMDLQKHQTTRSHQLARSSLPTRASLLAVPISDSSWSSQGCSLDLGGEHPPPFPNGDGSWSHSTLCSWLLSLPWCHLWVQWFPLQKLDNGGGECFSKFSWDWASWSFLKRQNTLSSSDLSLRL